MQEFKVKSSWLDRWRLLKLYPDRIEFENSNLRNAALTTYDKSEIVGFKYGIEWVTGYAFTFGRKYVIDVKTVNGAIIKIRLGSVYRIGLMEKHRSYAAIVNCLYDHYFDALSLSYIANFENDVPFELVGITFQKDGISLKTKEFIPWEEVQTRRYQTYFAVYSANNRNVVQLNYYLHDWNVGILYSVARKILMDKGFYTEEKAKIE